MSTIRSNDVAGIDHPSAVAIDRAGKRRTTIGGDRITLGHTRSEPNEVHSVVECASPSAGEAAFPSEITGAELVRSTHVQVFASIAFPDRQHGGSDGLHIIAITEIGSIARLIRHRTPELILPGHPLIHSGIGNKDAGNE